PRRAWDVNASYPQRQIRYQDEEGLRSEFPEQIRANRLEVLAHSAFGRVWIALANGFHDRAMLFDVASYPFRTEVQMSKPSPKMTPVCVDVAEYPVEQRISGRVGKRLVEFHVPTAERRNVVGRIAAREANVHSLDIVSRRPV